MAKSREQISVETEEKLAEFVGSFHYDPLGFVMANFPWGEPTLPDGSANPLKNKKGPEEWQVEFLIALGKHIRDNNIRQAIELAMEVWRSAVASGHGVGKSALVAWIIIFLMATRRDTRGVVTANTRGQLEDKTWPELAKWHHLSLVKSWFEWTATTYYFKLYPEDRRKNYMVTALTVSVENSEAFQGLHNEGNTIFMIFDEASGIDAKIWEVSTGALTDGEGFFFAFGNPNHPDGPFADCFDKNKEKYWLKNVDSRTISFTNKRALQDIIDLYGPDSDAARVRVYGQFPRQSFNGFILPDHVAAAQKCEIVHDAGAALIMSVDVARFGRNKSIIGFRQGRDARNFPVIKLHFTPKPPPWTPSRALAEEIKKWADKYRPDAIVIESTGPSTGVIDILREDGYRVVEVHPGAPASDKRHYNVARDEWWAEARDWLARGGAINDDPELATQLVKIQYSLDRNEQQIKIEPKKDYIDRTGLESPDEADQLILTFAAKVLRRDSNLRSAAGSATNHTTALSDYDPLAV